MTKSDWKSEWPHCVGARVEVSNVTHASHGDRGTIESIGAPDDAADGRAGYRCFAPIRVRLDDGGLERFWYMELRVLDVVEGLGSLRP